MSSGAHVSTPEEKLAALMAADLGVTTTPRELRMFIRANWRKLSAYAHAIHGSEGQQQLEPKQTSPIGDGETTHKGDDNA